MSETNSTPLHIFVTGADSELGRATVRHLVQQGKRVTGQVRNSKNLERLKTSGATGLVTDPTHIGEMTQALQTTQPDIVLNLTPQTANTLLHDGHNWEGFEQTLTASTAALLAAVKVTPVKFLIYTSYSLLYGNNLAANEETALRPINHPAFRAAMQAEKQLTESSVPHCIVRLGFLYGPQSRDLKLYRQSFNIFRPYFAGSRYHQASFLHYEDAATALALIIENQPDGEVFNVVDGTPTSFGKFIDTFAHKLGRPRPFHIPTWGAPLAQIIIKPVQMELLELATVVSNNKFRERFGWQPKYSSYRDGLAQVVQTWQAQTQAAR